MTTEDFKLFWDRNYSKTLPISYNFKYAYPERWFRIHSLPESKRYADTGQEWEILLARQNAILEDLMTTGSKFLLVIGDHHWEGYRESHPLSAVNSIKAFSFISLEPIDLHLADPEEYENGQVYTPMFMEQIWQPHAFDTILKDIADDNLRALFISPGKNCLVAPYDGGMDLIMKDPVTKDIYKKKYRDWLPGRDDGL